MDWFLYDSDLRHERVKILRFLYFQASVVLCWRFVNIFGIFYSAFIVKPFKKCFV